MVKFHQTRISDYIHHSLLNNKRYMEEASAVGIFSNIFGGITLGAILTYFGMSGETLTILTVVLVLDWIMGSLNAYLKGTLQSKIMARGLIKKLTRWCIPFIVIAVMRGAGFDNTSIIANSILSILIVAEGYSVIGHIYSINYDKNLAEIDALKLLLEGIAKIFKSKLDDKSDLSEKK